MNKKEEVTLQERLDALEYETGSRMDMFDSAIRNAGGFDKPAEVTFKDKLKLAGKWVVNHQEELLVASVTVVTSAVLHALHKSQKQETTPEAIGTVVPIKEFLSTTDNHRWGLIMHKYDGDGNEISRLDVADQLINGDYRQVDSDIVIFQEDDNNENR